MTETILITGGAGYIGSHAALAFLEAGHRVVVLDDLSNGRRDMVPDAAVFVHGNVRDEPLLDALFDQHKPAGVLHFAGSIVIAESITNPGLYYRNNTAASLALAEACLRHDVRRLVFSSTAAVYGIPEDGAARENSPTQPISPYGHSKLMTEQVLRDLSAAHGLTVAALRYFNVAGADPAGRIGQAGPNVTHLLKIASQVATGQRKDMSLFGTDYPTPDGTCIRDFIHVSDLADAHLAVYQHIVRTGENVVFNCGSERGASVREVINAVQRVLGRPIPVTESPRRPGDPPRLVADATKIRQTLGWKARHDLDSMIRSAVAWEQRLTAPTRR